MSRSTFRLCAVLILGLNLSACTETELASHWWKGWTGGEKPDGNAVAVSQQGGYKIGNPYKAGGKWYTPVESYSYDETGIASWYGDEFHGKRTANGEIFNKNELTAAHPTLQLPSLIRVTNLENGRSAVLRVNDRGPFARSRLIDVSRRSAEVLGFSNQGTARVRVQVLDRESRIVADAARKGYTPAQQMAMAFGREEAIQVASNEANGGIASTDLPPPSATTTNVTQSDIEDLNKQLYRKFPVSPTNIYIQVGSFSNANNAYALKQKLANLGNVNVYPSVVNGQPFNRVRIGPVSSVPEADSLLSRTIAAGYSTARIVVD